MKDFFAQQFALTPDQTQAVQHLSDFLESKNSCFILRGYAGTGKTFLLKGIANYFREIDREVVFAAPTGRAAKVIKERIGQPAYTIHKTIYNFKDLKESKSQDVDGSETFKLYYGLKENKDNVDAVYVIDEASMVSNMYAEGEFFRFGRGHLLNDLLTYINPAELGTNRKIIFVGDTAQLPPVKDKISPAISIDELGKWFTNVNTYELTEVVRQKASSNILTNATKLRESIRQKSFYRMRLDYDNHLFRNLRPAELGDAYRQLRTKYGIENTVMVAYANSTVNSYNRLARGQLFPGQPAVTNGDQVILVSNNYNYGIDLFNGDFARVTAVDDTITRRDVKIKQKQKNDEVITKHIPLTFRRVELAFSQPNGKEVLVNCLTFDHLLHSDERDLTSDETKALYVDFKIRHKHLPPGSEQFKRAMISDPMFNALRIKFGYAITCHKAQGGEWPAVIVDAKPTGGRNTSRYFRWLYTAITRSNQELHVMDAPNYDNGDNLRVTPTIGVPSNDAKPLVPRTLQISRPSNPAPAISSTPATAPPKSKPVKVPRPTQVLPDPQPTNMSSSPSPDLQENTFQPDFVTGQENLLALYEQVLRLMELPGFSVTNVTHNQYHEIYTFNRDDIQTRANIAYNGKGKVTNVRTIDTTDDQQELNTYLEQLKGFDTAAPAVALTPEAVAELSFPEPFLEEFYRTITDKVAPAGIGISEVKHQQYQEVYVFVRDGLRATYRFHYNGRQEFSNVSIIPNQTTGLTDELNSLFKTSTPS